MSLPQRITPPDLTPPGGHYSHATVHGGLVHVSGQLPITADGEKLVDADFQTQARQALANVAGALQAAGSSIEHLVQVRVYVSDIANWPQFNEIYADWAGATRPSRSIVPTGPLHFGFLIEIEALAAVQQK